MAEWRQSSYSNNGTCVEVAPLDGRIAIRNSNDPDAGTLYFGLGQWSAFLLGVKAGQLD